MSLQLNAPPAEEPVGLAAAKAYLKVDGGDEDDLIATLIAAARARAEWHAGRAFVTQGWTLWLDRDAIREVIDLPLMPLQAVSAITLYACDGSASLLDAARYFTDLTAGRVRLAAVPADLRPLNALAIAFTAGYGDAASVPAPIRTAILAILASLHAHRGDESAPMPDAALALLAPYRRVTL